MAPRRKPLDDNGSELVFVYSFVHHKTKRRVFAKNGKPFCFRVKRKAA